MLPRFCVRLLLSASALQRRVLCVAFALVGPRAAYGFTRVVARLIYHLLTPVRERSEAQCRAALGSHVDPLHVPRIAERAFVHRVLNLTDLFLASRLLHTGTYARCGGRVPQPHLSEMLDAQRRGEPAILVSAYFGPFDLLPVFLGYNGIRAWAVYLPHANADFDAFRRRVRTRSGCRLILAEEAAARMPAILEAGGSVALVADHHAEARGIDVTYLGLPTRVRRTVGILAARHDADVVVAGIRRVGVFRFSIEVRAVIRHTDYRDQPDPVAYVTQRYVRALERLVLSDPAQYLWAHARWGEEMARSLTAAAMPQP